jgi:hypothetical protein
MCVWMNDRSLTSSMACPFSAVCPCVCVVWWLVCLFGGCRPQKEMSRKHVHGRSNRSMQFKHHEMPSLWGTLPSVEPYVEVGVECARLRVGVGRIPPVVPAAMGSPAGGGRRCLRRGLLAT